MKYRLIHILIALLFATFTASAQRAIVRNFDTLTALQAVRPLTSEYVAVIKGVTSSSGKMTDSGAIWIFDSGASNTVNNTSILAPGSGNGRWFRPNYGDIAVTDGSTNTIFTVSIATNKVASVDFLISVHASDGTDYQMKSGRVTVDMANKAGTITSTVKHLAYDGALSSGTLTNDFYAVASGGNSVAIKIASDTSLTVTNASAMRAEYHINSILGTGTLSITP